MTKKKRAFAALLALALLFVLLSSACYIALESGHDCIGDDCPVCCRIGFCKLVLKTVGRAAVTGVAVASAGAVVCALTHFIVKTGNRPSLITLKVKLSD